MRAKALALALSLLWATGVGAAQDFNGTTGKATTTTLEITVPPFTVACWVNQDLSGDDIVFSFGDTGTINNYHYILLSTSGPNIAVQSRDASVSAGATTSAGWTPGTWAHVAGVWASSSSRAAYVDGGNKGTETSSITPAGLDTISLAVRIRTTEDLFLDGKLAECGIWNAALTDAEVATLAKGFAPPCVRRASLIAYYPMVRDTTSLKDRFSATANNLTLAGTTAAADHPRIMNCQ